MQVMWVLVAVKMVSGMNSGGQLNGSSYVGVGSLPHWQQVTAGVYAAESECETAAKALSHQSDVKPFSPRCQPERLQ